MKSLEQKLKYMYIYTYILHRCSGDKVLTEDSRKQSRQSQEVKESLAPVSTVTKPTIGKNRGGKCCKCIVFAFEQKEIIHA